MQIRLSDTSVQSDISVQSEFTNYSYYRNFIMYSRILVWFTKTYMPKIKNYTKAPYSTNIIYTFTYYFNFFTQSIDFNSHC